MRGVAIRLRFHVKRSKRMTTADGSINQIYGEQEPRTGSSQVRQQLVPGVVE